MSSSGTDHRGAPWRAVYGAAVFGAAVSCGALAVAWGGPLAPTELAAEAWLLVAFTLLPWGYLVVQARRVGDWPLGVVLNGVWGTCVALITGVVYALRLLDEAPGPQAHLTLALGPVVQGGMIGVFGLALAVAARWRR